MVTPVGGVCRNPPSSPTTSGSEGLLSSVVSAQTGCGSPTTPWTIDVGPGQRVNVTLIDFSAPASGVERRNASVATSRAHCQVTSPKLRVAAY